MQLITNKISTGKAGRFEDFIKNFKDSQIKTASVKTASVKTAENQEEAESSGQLDVEPLHQEGESTTMPKAGPSAKKDDGEKSVASKSDSEKEGKDSGQPKAEGSKKFTNSPKVPTKDEEDSKDIKEAGSLPEALKEYQFKAKDTTKTDDEDKDKDKDKDEEEKEASSSLRFVKWAKLDSKNKSFLTTYWKQLFGDDYVRALVSDK